MILVSIITVNRRTSARVPNNSDKVFDRTHFLRIACDRVIERRQRMRTNWHRGAVMPRREAEFVACFGECCPVCASPDHEGLITVARRSLDGDSLVPRTGDDFNSIGAGVTPSSIRPSSPLYLQMTNAARKRI